MNSYRRRAHRWYVLVIGSLLLGAPHIYSETVIEWPSPPEEPRIRYASTFSSADDFGRRASFARRIGRFLFGPEDQSMGRPYGIAVSGERIFVADPGNAVVHVYSQTNRRYERIARADRRPLISPLGVAVAQDGHVLVTDSERGEILIYDRRLKYVSSAGWDEQISRPTGIACSGNMLYVSDTGSHRVLAYELMQGEAEYRFSFGTRGVSAGQFNYPVDIAVSTDGRIYVNDTMNFRIQVFDGRGTYIREVGAPGDSTGYFQRSKGISLDTDGNLYVVDALADTVQIFNADGTFLLNFGSSGTGAGEFWLPAGMTIDGANTIYVADAHNRRVQIFQYVGGWLR